MLNRVKNKVLSLAMGLGLSACGPSAPASDNLGKLVFSDSFEAAGPLQGYVVNNADALKTVQSKDGRYHALIADNPNDITLHFNDKQGRLDAQLVQFPFNVVVRNIGIGSEKKTQVAPAHGVNTYIFAGVQVHHKNLTDPISSHVVVGHRGKNFSTVEGKNTPNGSSFVNDIGQGKAHEGRADLLIQGLADRTLQVFWQKPNMNIGKTKDKWIPYNGHGALPGEKPTFGDEVYVGLITYAFRDKGMPFVGTADSWEIYKPEK